MITSRYSILRYVMMMMMIMMMMMMFIKPLLIQIMEFFLLFYDIIMYIDDVNNRYSRT